MAADEKPEGTDNKNESEDAPLNRAERRARARQKKQAEPGQEHQAPTMKEMFSRKRSPFSGS